SALSASGNGATRVHSESRQPRISSSSAISSNSSLTCLLQLLLERIAVDAVVVPVQLVDELLDPHDRPALDHPERDRLAAAAELLARVRLGKVLVGGLDRGGGVGGLALVPFASSFGT